MRLIIQIPCFNEAGTLPIVLNGIPTQIEGFDSVETLVIDDGSTDQTSEKAVELGVNHVVRHSSNRGLAAAFKTGLSKALDLGADVIINTDGDNQYPGESIPLLLGPILEGEAELVIGDRSPGSDSRTSSTKRFLQRIGRRVISLLAGRDLPDPVSGFRAMTRDAALKIHVISNYSYTIESLLQAINKGVSIRFVPVHTNAPTRPSRLFRSLPHFIARSASTTLRVFFMYRALHVFVALSGLVALVGSAPILRFLYLFSIGQGDGHVQSLILGAAILVLAGLILVAGLLADLIASNRIMIEDTLERVRRQEAERANHR